jgi:ubiquinone biosynthesis monooxygenase Coq6
VAIVATLKLKDAGVNDTAWQRFLSSGPIALLPLNDEYSSLVWSIKKSLAKDVLSLSDEELVAKINHAFVSD